MVELSKIPARLILDMAELKVVYVVEPNPEKNAIVLMFKCMLC